MVYCSTEVVNIGDEDNLSALSNELVQQARLPQRPVDISMTRRVPPEGQR